MPNDRTGAVPKQQAPANRAQATPAPKLAPPAPVADSREVTDLGASLEQEVSTVPAQGAQARADVATAPGGSMRVDATTSTSDLVEVVVPYGAGGQQHIVYGKDDTGKNVRRVSGQSVHLSRQDAERLGFIASGYVPDGSSRVVAPPSSLPINLGVPGMSLAGGPPSPAGSVLIPGPQASQVQGAPGFASQGPGIQSHLIPPPGPFPGTGQ